jgi:hypothetical protein
MGFFKLLTPVDIWSDLVLCGNMQEFTHISTTLRVLKHKKVSTFATNLEKEPKDANDSVQMLNLLEGSRC